jgi:hypothetical protein
MGSPPGFFTPPPPEHVLRPVWPRTVIVVCVRSLNFSWFLGEFCVGSALLELYAVRNAELDDVARIGLEFSALGYVIKY